MKTNESVEAVLFAKDIGIQADDDDDDNAADTEGHDSLVKMLLKNSKFDEKNFRWQAKRTAVGEQSELGIGKARQTKISLGKLMRISKNVTAKKGLRGFERKPLLRAPLKTPLANKAARAVNFAEVQSEIAKYDSIVKANRHADQLVFPAEQQKVSFNIAAQFGTSISEKNNPKQNNQQQPKSRLEKEITELIAANDDNVETDARPLTTNEIAVLQATNIENARAIHREIQRRRALISFREAKFRRLRRVKSKQFHRLQKRDRIKKATEEFDQAISGDGADPEQAIEKLHELDRLRALERASLKHRVTGKWAKYRKIRSKYDDQAREELNEQLAINQQLMLRRSLGIAGDDDDEDDDDEEEEEEQKKNNNSTTTTTSATESAFEVIDVPNDYNPWISSVKSSKMLKKKQNEIKSKSAAAAKPSTNTVTDQEFFGNRIERRIRENEEAESQEAARRDAIDVKEIDEKRHADDDDDDQNMQDQSMFDADNLRQNDFERKNQNQSRKSINLQLDDVMITDDPSNNYRNKNKNNSSKLDKRLAEISDDENHADDVEIDAEEEEIGGAADFGGIDFRGNDMQRYLREAFMDDDVVQDFLREKKQKSIEDAELTGDDDDDDPRRRRRGGGSSYLPGWGSWAGGGIVDTRRKRARHVRQIVKREKRQDSRIANAIILNDSAISAIGDRFRVSYRPAAISSVERFERRCAKPVGASWNPQTIFRTMIEPKIVTPIGAIIEPMSAAPDATATASTTSVENSKNHRFNSSKLNNNNRSKNNNNNNDKKSIPNKSRAKRRALSGK